MSDLMVDIETLGNDPNSLILQIGACYFDRYTGEILNTFLVDIDPESSERWNFKINASTVMWWLSQSKEAQNGLNNNLKVDVKEAIQSFDNFLTNDVKIWNHASFDIVLLQWHYKRLNIKQSFKYWQSKDIRTLVDLADIDTRDYEREGTYHNSLDDCKFQVKYCVDCFNKLKGE